VAGSTGRLERCARFVNGAQSPHGLASRSRDLIDVEIEKFM
jgi:hypothetical protein